MPTRREVDLDHSKFFLNVLRQLADLYSHGGEDLTATLSQFDEDWPQIEWGQELAARYAQEDETAAILCSLYPAQGADLFLLRISAPKRETWSQAGLTAARRLNKKFFEERGSFNLGLAL